MLSPMGVLLRIKSYLLIAAGLALVIWAGFQISTEIVPALQPTPTSAEVVLESYAPNTGPLANPALNDRVAASGEIESLPVTELIPIEAPAAQPTEPLAVSAPTATLPANIPTEDASTDNNNFLVEIEPTTATTEPAVKPAVPTRIVIPAIQLDAPVTFAASQKISLGGKVYYQWLSPDKYAAGWHTNSAYPGFPGNTVINGHHNIFGKVFEHLVDTNVGDLIDLYAGDTTFHYIIVKKMIVEERDAPVEQRLENARWLARSEDERLTLITCWPATSNTHRLIIVAIPDPAQK